MNWRIWFSRDTRHLRIVAVLLVAGGAAGAWLRQQLVPASFGERGPFRTAAVEENLSRPIRITTDEACLKCHDDVREERAESPHQAVACMHCHGLGRDHIAKAEQAALTPDAEIPTATEWDGDFRTHADLFIAADRAMCLSCHLKVVGMPETFRSINVAEHLEEEGASEPDARDTCFECHGNHDPGL